MENPTGLPVVVAEGRPPKPPQPGRAEALFSETPVLVGPKELPDGRVDYRSIRQIPTVEPGTTIAVAHDPVPGADGADVFGHPVPAAPPQPVRLVPGPGVETDPDGHRVYATIAGRPMYAEHGNRFFVSVVALYVHEGDVLITGSVLDTMRVTAEGSVKILGDVSRATVNAGQ